MMKMLLMKMKLLCMKQSLECYRFALFFNRLLLLSSKKITYLPCAEMKAGLGERKRLCVFATDSLMFR